jgi:hypothetical protein
MTGEPVTLIQLFSVSALLVTHHISSDKPLDMMSLRTLIGIVKFFLVNVLLQASFDFIYFKQEFLFMQYQ